MVIYTLSKETARQMLATWFSLSLSLTDSAATHSACSMFTVFDPSGIGSTVSLKELHASDVVRFHATPTDLVEQEEVVPYGKILATIIDVASGPVATPPDGAPRFIITYH